MIENSLQNTYSHIESNDIKLKNLQVHRTACQATLYLNTVSNETFDLV